MKLSFSLPPKQASRTNIRSSQNFSEDDTGKDSGKTATHEYVTEFDPSRKTPSHNVPKMIIPPKQNEWRRPEKKMKNLELPLHSRADPELCFEVEAPSMAGEPSDAGMSFGLNLRQTPAEDGGVVTSSVKRSSDGAHDIITNGSKRSAPGVEGTLLQKLKDELQTMPEDVGLEEFNDVPVEGFGAALLAGYGWSEGQGIGRNAKADVKVYEIKKKTAKEGLGFITEVPGSKPKEHNNIAAEGSRQPKWISVGNTVRIVGGKHVGLKGQIIEILGADSDAPSVALKLPRNEKEASVHFHDIAEMGSLEEEKCLKKLKELEIQGQKSRRSRDERRVSSGSHRHREKRDVDVDVGDKWKDSKRGRNDGRRVDEVKHGKGEASQSQRQNKNKLAPISWLTSNIRVKIISKDFKGGRLYLKKGEVVDVVGPTTCDITMDDSRELIQGVHQDLLETALPCRGGQVIVLFGKHKGVLGSLVRRDLDEETGVVQDADSHDLLQVRLEQIAEYVGDPSFLDY